MKERRERFLEQEPKPRKRCGAPLPRDPKQLCRQLAGAGTKHPGQGYCRWHDKPKQPPPPALEYGEKLESPRIRDLFLSFMESRDPMNVLEELALLRALTLDYVNRAEALESALLAWHASFTSDFRDAWQEHAVRLAEARNEEDWETYHDLIVELPTPHDFMNRPRKVMDLADAHKLLLGISTIIDRLERQRDAGSIPIKALMTLFGDLANVAVNVAREHISDPTERATFLAHLGTAWERLHVGGNQRPHDTTP